MVDNGDLNSLLQNQKQAALSHFCLYLMYKVTKKL